MRLQIEPKKKKCKGTGLAKGYGCGDMTFHRHYGLCKAKCYPDWLLNSELGKIKMRKALLKASKPRKELEAMGKERKERLSLPRALKLTQEAFNAYIRERDKYKPCISSGNPWKDDHDAGHLFSVKQYPALRFDEDNCHGQSVGENRFKEGNFQDYVINVQTRIGRDKFNSLMKRAEHSKREFKRWTVDELKEIRSLYRNKLKNISNEN